MTKGRRQLNERGFAAIIISIVLVVLLSLITVGFAALMRKEQRSALDRQLSNAAYYAAESGVNDAVGAVRAGFTATKDKCAQYGNGPNDTPLSSLNGTSKQAASKFLTSSDVDNTSNTNYSCLIINPNPSTLEYSSIKVGQATTAVLTGSDASGNPENVNVLVFSWQDAGTNTTYGPVTTSASCPAVAGFVLPSVNCWQHNGSNMIGMLRVGLTPINVALHRDTLETSSYTGYLYPIGGAQTSVGGSFFGAAPAGVPRDAYGANSTGVNGGDIVNGVCNQSSTPRHCAVAVTNLNNDTYLLTLSSIYAPTEVTVTPYNCSGGNCTRISLQGAQTLIDSTGKAQDVLRRIQVRLPARNSFDYPEFSLATGGPICKLLTTYPPNATSGTPGSTVNTCEAGLTPGGL